jgi:hypothetical protein
VQGISFHPNKQTNKQTKGRSLRNNSLRFDRRANSVGIVPENKLFAVSQSYRTAKWYKKSIQVQRGQEKIFKKRVSLGIKEFQNESPTQNNKYAHQDSRIGDWT